MIKNIKHLKIAFKIKTNFIFKNSAKFCFQSANNNNNLNNEKTNFENNSTLKDEKLIEYPEIVDYLFNKSVKGKKNPCFEVYSSQIEILSQPMDFYLAIIVQIDYFILETNKKCKRKNLYLYSLFRNW